MYDENKLKPVKNTQLIGLYELLVSLISSLTPMITEKSLRDGTGDKFNGYVDELVSLTQDGKLDDFKVRVRSVNGNRVVSGDTYVRGLIGVVNYLHRTNEVIGYYCGLPAMPELGGSQSSSPTIANHFNAEQQNHQTTTVQVEFNQTIISLTERLTNLERDYPDALSKENQFAKKLKASLPNVKDMLSITSLVLKLTSELGLDPSHVLKLLGLN